MVCDKADGYVGIIILLVLGFPEILHTRLRSAQIVSTSKMESTSCTTNCQTFQTHSCINVLLFQCCIISVTIVLKLGKYIVPYFHVTVTVATNGTARFTTTVFLPTVIIDFRTWATGTCAVFPEIVFFAKFENSLSRDSDLFVPDVECFIIFQVYRRIKTVWHPVLLPL